VNFTWYADADQQTDNKDGSYCYVRYVRNQHAKKPLNFDWPLGRLSSPRLSPGGLSRFCTTYQKPKNPVSNGPLTYGLHNEQVTTQVWEGEDEPPAKTGGISVRVEFDLYEDGRSDRVALEFLSRVILGVQQVYTYEIRNRMPHKVPYKFIWESALSIPFLQEMKRRSYPEFPIDLSKFEVLKIELVSDAPPQLSAKGLRIYDSKGHLAAAAGVPAWVPRPTTPK